MQIRLAAWNIECELKICFKNVNKKLTSSHLRANPDADNSASWFWDKSMGSQCVFDKKKACMRRTIEKESDKKK